MDNRNFEIKFERTGSLFWLASELRKARLFLEPEVPTHDRVIDGLDQIIHHAKQISVSEQLINKVVDVSNNIQKTGFSNLSESEKHQYAECLRGVMDQIATVAVKNEKDFQPGPRAGRNPGPRV